MRRLLLMLAVPIVLASPAFAQSPSDALFDSATVQRVDLRLHSADWEKLKQNFQENTYYPADVVFNGQTVRNAGIRSRGLGSRNARKPGLRVDFDRYSTDQTFLGLKSFVLDNLTQDASGIRETVTMKLFERLGIPAPREGHVRLYVNNEFIGLYATVESIDKSFLARVFGSIGDDVQNDGYLYEFNYIDRWAFAYPGSALDFYKTRFDAKTHENASEVDKWGPIENLVRLANELSVDQLVPVLSEHLDLHQFMRYVAAQNFVGQNDGFLGYEGINNFYFYRLENSTQHVFIAWDEDNAFWGTDFAIDTRHDENVLMRKAMQVPELRDTYYSALREAARLSEEPSGPEALPWFEYEVRRQLALIDSAMREDANKPYSNDEFDAGRNAAIQFARDRARYVLDAVDRR
jgi:spore coat protein CotH